MPYIGKAILATKTRQMSTQCIEICKCLAPYIYESCKMAQNDVLAKQELEKMLADLLKSIIDHSEFNLSENDEEEDDGSSNSTFPFSDLTVTLDDETYDKLMNNSNKSKNSDGNGINIRREHPKDDEKKESKDDTNGSGSNKQSSDEKSDSESNKESQSSDSKSKQEAKDSSEKRSENSSGQESIENNKDSKSDKASKQSSKPNSDSESSDGQDSTGNENSVKNLSKDEVKQKEKEIEKAMEQAATQAKADAEKRIESVDTAYVAEKKAAQSKQGSFKETTDNSKPISSESMRDICNFAEVKRKYKITEILPPDINMRGKTLRKKNQSYFKGLCTPNISYLDSGSIDPSRIFGLSFGDTDIFRKIGKDKKFDGCAYILIDNSGSMSGNKKREACKAAAIIEEGFKGLFPFKIVAFDEWGTVTHEIIKNWNEQYNKNCCWNFLKFGRNGGGNADGFDIQIATRELLNRPESKKLLVVLSDGMPSEATPGYTKGAIEAARKKGIQVSGIYFEEGRVGAHANQFKEMYQKDYICCSSSEIDQNLTKIFMKFSRN